MADGAQPDIGTELQLTVSEQDAGSCVVAVAGELDLHTAPRLQALLEELLVANEQVVVDGSAVRFIDSSGLGALIAAMKAARERGGDIALRDPSRIMTKLLQITKLDDVFTRA